MKSRKITGIIIHCAATPNGRWHDVHDIDAWHKSFGFKRSSEFRQRQNPDLVSIGYHFVIYTNGALATGRHLNEVGAHARGFNSRTIGVCMIGTDHFHLQQWQTLCDHIQHLQKQFSGVRIAGHRNLPYVKKACPGFDVSKWIEGGMEPLAGHILGNPS